MAASISWLSRHDTIDQAEPHRLVRVDRLTEQQQLLRLDRTDEQRQQLRQPAGDTEPEADLREPEARALGSDDEVTSEREFRARTDRVPVHRGDHRDGETADSPGDLLQVFESTQQAVVVAARFLQVMAGAERSSPTGQHRRTAVARLDLGQGVEQPFDKLVVDRVEPVRAVERDHRDVGIDGENNRSVVGLQRRHSRPS